MFSGKVFCQSCGAPLGVTTTRGKRYLQCLTRHTRRTDCPGAFVAEQALERAVLQELNTILMEYGPRLAAEWVQMHAKEKLALKKKQTICQHTLTQYQNSLRLLYLDRAAGRICEADYQAVAEQLERDLSRLHSSAPSCQIPTEQEETIAHVTPKTLSSMTAQMAARTIERILVAPRAVGTRVVEVTVIWRF